MIKSQRDLQWPQLLELIATGCVREEAEAAIRALQPFARPAQAEERHEMLREAMRLLATAASLPIRAFEPLAELLAQLERGVPGSAEQLRDTAKMLGVSTALRGYLKEHSADCPTLQRKLWTAPELDALGGRLRRAINDSAEILDSASNELQEARGNLSRFRKKIRSAQLGLLKRYGSALSGQFFAERDGRLVLPVRTDSANQVPGIVLGSSASGGTLYVEPKELTEPNNKVRIHEAQVAQEEAKVLQSLSADATSLLPELNQAVSAVIEADCIRAIADWADRSDARPPRIHAEPIISLKQVRHPLLIGGTPDAVANDVKLRAGQCIIISGPNAGGKTVAMKCLGLAALMLRAGLPIPCAEESTIGWFDQIFTNIGDEQSLSRSLSTFSAHIENVAQALSESRGGTLVLLDELAGGTDPEEGSALAVALLEAFVEKGAAIAVTTHYEKLKQLGAQPGDSFVNASVGFDMSRLEPTFHLAQGVPGASSAFTVAGRYGIPQAVLTRAKDLIPKDQLTQEELIAQLETERQKLKGARVEIEKELAQQVQLREQLQSEKTRALDQERARLAKEAQALNAEVKEARAFIQKAKSAINQQNALGSSLREAEQWVSQAAKPIALGGSLTSAVQRPTDNSQPPSLSELTTGTPVMLSHLGSEGSVIQVKKNGTIRVSVGGLKMSVPLAQLRLKPKQKKSQQSAPSKKRKSALSTTAAGSGYEPVRTASNTCDLRGQRVEAGLDLLDEFVDSMLQKSEHAAFVLHGHGTGAMKEAVRTHLGNSGYISKCEKATPEDGGDALTLFWFRD